MHTADERPFGHATARLRLLLRLAAVSKGLHRAASAAARGLQTCLVLDVDPGLPSWALSPALASLTGPIFHIRSGHPLLASWQAAAFLKAKAVCDMRVDFWGSEIEAAEAIGEQAAGWTTLERLNWICKQAPLLPGSLPPFLNKLIIRFLCNAGAADMEDLFTELCLCQDINHLALLFEAQPAALPQGLLYPDSLKLLELIFRGEVAAGQVNLGLLGQLRCPTVRVMLKAGRLSSSSLLLLLQAVPRSCRLEQLCIATQSPISAAAQLALSATTTRVAYIQSAAHEDVTQLPAAEHILLCLDSAAVSRGALSTSPGVYSFLEGSDTVVVEGCTDVMPAHALPWAVFVREWDCIEGLPLARFHQLLTGWWVWQNSAAAQLGLQEPVQLD